MRILSFSDLHDEEDALERLRSVYSNSIFDFVFILGDTTNYSYSFLEETVSSFKNCFFIPGNNEPTSIVDKSSTLKGFLHEKVSTAGDFKVAGFGLSPPTPFGTPGEVPEEQIYHSLLKLGIDRTTILLTHCPPYGILDQTRKGPAGSTSLLRIIKEHNPFALFCGHIHENKGVQQVGRTTVIKVPAARAYEYTVAEISEKGVTADFFRL